LNISGVRVLTRNLWAAAFFHVSTFYSNCTSARYAITANSVSSDSDIMRRQPITLSIKLGIIIIIIIIIINRKAS
jgi:hypothetical protein